MRLTLLADVELRGAVLLVSEVADDAGRRTDIAPLARMCGKAVLVTFESDADALARRTLVQDVLRDERARFERVYSETMTGAEVCDDTAVRLALLIERMCSGWDVGQ